MSDLYNDFLKNNTSDEYATEKVNVISNCLLGTYDQDGDYVIPNNIVEELVNVKKVKKSVFKNSVFCGAFVPGYGEMVFEVTFQKNTVKDVAMSELYVLENEYKVNGYIQNTIRTKISTFTEKLEGFIENTYDHFHINLNSNSDDKNVKEFKVTDEVYTLDYINAKRNFNINMAKLTKKEYNKLYKEYVTAKLELLKGLKTPYSQAVLERFNQEYSKIEKFFFQTENYKAVSELLDKCIEDIQSTNPLFAMQEQEFNEKSKPLIEEFSKCANDIALKAHPKAVSELNKDDRVRNEELEQELQQQKTSAKPVKQPATQEKTNSSVGDRLSVLSQKVGNNSAPSQEEAKSVVAPSKDSSIQKDEKNPDLIKGGNPVSTHSKNAEQSNNAPKQSLLKSVLDNIEEKIISDEAEKEVNTSDKSNWYLFK